MSTSGTFGFAPSVGEVILQAYRRIGVRRVAITNEQMLDARMELNLLASEWSNGGPNLWAVDLQGPFTLSPGQATLTLDPATVDVLDLWITVNGVDRTLASISRTAYAEQAAKSQQGQPSSFWLDKAAPMTLTLWPVPDAPYTLSFFRSRQTQDAVTAGCVAPDTPFRFLDALVWCLADRLAFIYDKSQLAETAPRARQALMDARAEDTEDAPVAFTPALGGYFR